MHNPPRATSSTLTRALRARPRHHRGMGMLEVVVFMFILALVAGSATIAATNAAQSQGFTKRSDIAGQAASGLLEEAQALPWDSLGYISSDLPASRSFEGRNIVELGPTAPAAGYIRPRQTLTIKGTTVTLENWVTWVSGPAATGFGTKRVTSRVTFASAGGKTRTEVYTFDRTSSPTEARPDGAIPSGDPAVLPAVPTPTVTPSGTAVDPDDEDVEGYDYTTGSVNYSRCPYWTVTPGAGTAVLNWTAVPSSTYTLYVDNVVRATITNASTTSYTFTGLSGEQHKFGFAITTGTLANSYCGNKYAVVQEKPVMTCPTNVNIAAPKPPGGTLDIEWDFVKGAQRYGVFITGAATRSFYVDSPDTSTVLSDLPYGTYNVRVTARWNTDESTGCTTRSIYVPPGQPRCPTITATRDYANNYLYFYYTGVANSPYSNIRIYQPDGTLRRNTTQTLYEGSTYGRSYYNPQEGEWSIDVDPYDLDYQLVDCPTFKVEWAPPPVECPTDPRTSTSRIVSNWYYYNGQYYYDSYRYWQLRWNPSPSTSYYNVYRNGSYYSNTSGTQMDAYYGSTSDRWTVYAVDFSGRQSQGCEPLQVTFQ